MSATSEFFAVVRAQRACRSFTDEAVPDELIEQVLEVATFAPSAENRQPWEFVVVRELATRAAMGELMRRAWEGGGRAFSEGRLPPKMLADVDRGATGGMAGAPVLVVVGADTQRSLAVTVASSTFPAIQNLLLAAGALGLGSALTTLGTAFETELRELAGFPEHVVPVAIVPLGWPARPLGLSRRDPVTEHTHRERYGAAW